MITFNKVNRRTHLYLAMFLLPWFLMYGISSIVFNHTEIFRPQGAAPPTWSVRLDKQYQAPIDIQGTDPMQAAEAILKANGIEAPFRANRTPAGALNIMQLSFTKQTRVTYWPDKQRLLVEDRKVPVYQVFLGMHAREVISQQKSTANTIWSIVGVDLVVLAMLIWVGTGFYMWWGLPQSRLWGWASIAGGVALFALFVAGL